MPTTKQHQSGIILRHLAHIYMPAAGLKTELDSAFWYACRCGGGGRRCTHFSSPAMIVSKATVVKIAGIG